MVMTTDRKELRKPRQSRAQRAAAGAIQELRDSGALAGLFAKINAGQLQLA